MGLLFENNICCTFIHFDELEKASNWYVNTLGFSIRKIDLAKGFVELEMEGANLTLLTWRSKEKIRPKHPLFTFYSLDIEESYHKLKNIGVKVHNFSNAGSVSGFLFEDLEGNILMVCS
ncbi:VOC family protein [Bacillus sp. SM2101]|uniref:VOC family protein n=1 Tax=Bacillus sp. SM2101 TaxID=2805366 RepID=UPI001BDF55BB|nr:VOC family protein [Bacillus sp. SM2101]